MLSVNWIRKTPVNSMMSLSQTCGYSLVCEFVCCFPHCPQDVPVLPCSCGNQPLSGRQWRVWISDFVSATQMAPVNRHVGENSFVSWMCDSGQLRLSAVAAVWQIIYLSKVFSCVYKSDLDRVFAPELALDQNEDNLAQEAWQITG